MATETTSKDGTKVVPSLFFKRDLRFLYMLNDSALTADIKLDIRVLTKNQ
jgi:hypothetical protein